MFNQQNIFQSTSSVNSAEASSYMNKVFLSMGVGLLVTAITANWTVSNIGFIPESWYLYLFEPRKHNQNKISGDYETQ